MYGHESRPSRIYSYKAHAPAEDFDLVSDQMRLAHRYRNRLIEIERDRRGKVEGAIRSHAPAIPAMDREIEECESRIEAIHRGIKTRNQVERKRSTTDGEKAELAELRGRLKESRRLLKEARAVAFADPRFAEIITGIDAVHIETQKEARAACGLYWGTYLLIEQSLSSIRKGAPPRFRRWDGDGSIAVQLQGGLDWSEALACSDLRLRVEKSPTGPAADPDSVRSRNTTRAVVWMRAGSGGRNGREPLWVRIPTILHREPPHGSRIKWAYLHRERVGVGSAWKVQFVLERDEWDRDHAADGVVGIDVNWRSMPAGLRVAYAMGDDGRDMPLFVPREWLDQWTKVESLQSIRGRNFDAARGELARWKAEAGAGALPEWFAERTAYLAHWKSSDRMGAAVWHWKDHRFPGDESIYPVMEAWRKQERHLHDWQDNQHRKVVRRRDDLYRRFAVGLAKDYRTARIEDTDWKSIKRRPSPDERDDSAAARIYGHIAAPGRLSELIREAFATTEEIPAADTTRKCHECGRVDEFDAARDLHHTCSGCGSRWDQDRNAALNLRDGGAVAGIDRGADAAGGECAA